MKTIKLEVTVFGYLEDGNYESFDSEKHSISVECVKNLDNAALTFLKESFEEIAKVALAKYYEKEKDFQEVKR